MGSLVGFRVGIGVGSAVAMIMTICRSNSSRRSTNSAQQLTCDQRLCLRSGAFICGSPTLQREREREREKLDRIGEIFNVALHAASYLATEGKCSHFFSFELSHPVKAVKTKLMSFNLTNLRQNLTTAAGCEPILEIMRGLTKDPELPLSFLSERT